MSTAHTAERLAAVVAAAMESAGVNTLALSQTTNIPRATLQRRLSDGRFTSLDLFAIGEALSIPASRLVADAERAA